MGSQGGGGLSYQRKRACWDARCQSRLAKSVLVCLESYAGKDNRAWPSQTTIAHDCETTRRSIQEVIAQLASLGHITVIKDHGRTKTGFARYGYIIHPRAPTREAASPVTHPPTREVDASTREVAALTREVASHELSGTIKGTINTPLPPKVNSHNGVSGHTQAGRGGRGGGSVHSDF